MTTKEYIKNLDFDYLETYSLLRDSDQKYSNHVRGTKKALIETGLPHPTAHRTHVLTKADLRTQELVALLSIDFTTQHDWMCAPVFREMVVFYDGSGNIVSLLHICLSCDRVEDENGNDIKTDTTTFKGLKTYFQSLGHSILEQ